MPRRLAPLVALCVVLTTLGLAPATNAAAPRAAAAPLHHVTVSGSGVAMYPAYAPGIGRYAVTTTSDTRGTVTVTATTGDAHGVVRIDGRTTPTGSRTLTGLQPGDEIAVFISDSAGTEATSLIYLPTGFPTLQRDDSTTVGGPSPGLTLLTLGLWTQQSPYFETGVDANGVPAFVHQTANSMDLKPLPGGHYSVARRTTAPGRDGYDIVELDQRFREVARRRTVGLINTDGHDSILLPDGSYYVIAYEPDKTTGMTDAVIQEINPAGDVVFSWNSADHVDVAAETVKANDPDYAHINSIQVMSNGDLLVSFRHLSSVFEVARHAHDGYAEGDVVWKLGGRRSDWTFVDADGEPDDGPCAQHTAYQLPNGHILTFDNGSATFTTALCVDQSDPSGPVIERFPTRIAEWALDESSHVATLVWNYQHQGRFSIFAGSAQRLTNGNTVIGWASATDAVASEVDAQGRLLWDLKAVDKPKYFTYRAFRAAVPDVQAPVVSVATPAEGATYVEGARVTPVADCTDTGGSSLRTCAVGALTTAAPGRHSYTVTATDGAGNRTTVTRHYTVVPAYRPDAAIRLPGRAFVGTGAYAPAAQHVDATLTRARRSATAVVRLTNRGHRADRLAISPTGSGRRFRLTLAGLPGNRRSPLLAPGASWSFRVRVARRPATKGGDRRRFRVVATSVHDPRLRDVVALVVRVRR